MALHNMPQLGTMLMPGAGAYGDECIRLATLAAGGMGDRKGKFEPYAGEFVHVPAPTCYRCPLGLEYPTCKVACAQAIETTILSEAPETVAEVIVEPIYPKPQPRVSRSISTPDLAA